MPVFRIRNLYKDFDFTANFTSTVNQMVIMTVKRL